MGQAKVHLIACLSDLWLALSCCLNQLLKNYTIRCLIMVATIPMLKIYPCLEAMLLLLSLMKVKGFDFI